MEKINDNKIENEDFQKKIEEAKKILHENNQRIIEEATKEFSDFINVWTEKYKCRLSVYTNTIDNYVKSEIKIVKIDD